MCHFFLTLMQEATFSFMKPLVKPKVSRALKRKVDADVYEVERVMNVRTQKGKLLFEIEWLGYDKTTWDPKTNWRDKHVSYF